MSDILFQEFYKIAAEKDLIDSRETRTRKVKDDSYSKDYIDTIRALYNIDPRESKKSITEEAHPETCVISPAYDKTWGIVENGEEAQALNAKIVFKETNPTTNIRLVAKQEMLEALIKASMILENEGHEELTKIAEDLAESIADEMDKELGI